ncbi:MAG: TetR/AcrR family transcriptional regulator [Proteobacteria bacterium]|nr:MAG: TetR/AcrR family transcriptional regulator [Pseudomonadota bacterium]
MPARPPRRRLPAPDGPLAERLVAAADDILEQDGLAALSMREVARRAGVTHGAPLRHYRSFAALLSEVAAAGFRELAHAVDEGAAAVPSGSPSTARLAAAARAYVACAVKRPGRFGVMFRPELLDVEHPAFVRDATHAFEQLVRLVRAAQDAGWRPDTDTRRLAGSLWAGVHGLATLWIDASYAAVVRVSSLDDALEDQLRFLLGADAAPGRAPTTANHEREE